MPMTDSLSEARLTGVHPELARRVRAADSAMAAASGEHFRIAQALRSGPQQAADYAVGRTVPGKIKTNARPFYSWHQFGLAVDCYPFLHGASGDLDWNAADPEFHRMVTVMQAQHLAWGGEWHSIQDPPHFQPAELPVTPTDADRAAYTAGGFPAVWARYPELGLFTVHAGAHHLDSHTLSTVWNWTAGAAATLINRRFWRDVRYAWRNAQHHARRTHAVLTGKPGA